MGKYGKYDSDYVVKRRNVAINVRKKKLWKRWFGNMKARMMKMRMRNQLMLEKRLIRVPGYRGPVWLDSTDIGYKDVYNTYRRR